MKKRIIFILFGLISSILALYLYKQSFPDIQQIDFRFKDARFRVRGEVKPDKDVAIIAIDHKSIKELGRWPWSREVTGKLIENLSLKYKTSVTALDIVFSEPQGKSADASLATSINNAGNVVMGYFFRDEQNQISDDAARQLESAKLKLVKIEDGVQNIPLHEFQNVDFNIPEIGVGARDFGFFNARPDSDGLYRRAILLTLFNGDIYPSLAMKALQHHTKQESMLDVKKFGVDSLQLGSLRIPSREDGTMALNFYGKAGSFKTVSAVDVIKERLKPEELKGKIAFVGATEIGIYDLRPAPFDPTLPGIELHATMAANALEKRFLKYDGVTQQLEIICIAAFPVILGIALSLSPGAITALISFFITSMLFALANYQFFATAFRDLTLIYPIIGLGLTYISSEAWRNLVVEKKGKQLKKAFSNYVSPDLVKQIEKDPDKLVLGGEQRELTILFSDIRGFTTVSESLTPPELVKLLNEYLSPMTKIVLEERGTLDKFIGDAVMALFNAPLDVPEHPLHACKAAIKMMDELNNLNREFAAREMNTIDIGIGINTGPAVVGNMGADIRFDYTAIGDSVNLASRLEGLNKYYGTHILVSEDTRNLVSDSSFHFREVDRVKVKGKKLPVLIYELMTKNFELLSSFNEALAVYRDKNFVNALSAFKTLADNYADAPSTLYIKRCEEYIESPPPSDWDGVYTATSK